MIFQRFLCLLIVFSFCVFPVSANESCPTPGASVSSPSRGVLQYAHNQTELTPLDILILDLQDVKRLIEEGNNKTAIVILKSALGNVRKVKEFNKTTKKTTEKRIKQGIKLLKQGKSEEALDLLDTAVAALEEAGLVPPGTFD